MEDRLARFEDAHSRYGRVRAGAAALERDLASLEVTSGSQDGSIAVVVGARGDIKQLTIAGQPELTAAVLDAIQSAQTLAAQAVQDRLNQTLEGSDVAHLLRRHDERMGFDHAA